MLPAVCDILLVGMVVVVVVVAAEFIGTVM